jgi:hypothetical protein
MSKKNIHVVDVQINAQMTLLLPNQTHRSISFHQKLCYSAIPSPYCIKYPQTKSLEFTHKYESSHIIPYYNPISSQLLFIQAHGGAPKLKVGL